MLRYIIQKSILSFFFFASFTGYSQTVKWPTITQVNKPWSRWWWEGSAVNKTDLTAVAGTGLFAISAKDKSA